MPTSLIGAIGLGRQSAKDVLASTISYLPATSVGLSPQQNVATLPPEVGGSYFLRGSYKTAFTGSGDLSMIVRPNGFGQFLMAFSGVDTVTPVPGQTGAYSHLFTPFAPASGVDLPWFTLNRGVSRLWSEQYLNAKLRSLRVDVPKASTVTASTSWLATTPSYIADVGAVTVESTPQFQTALGVVDLKQESGSDISVNSNKMERISISMGNQISEDEFSVGSFYLDGITLLQKSLAIDCDFVIREPNLVQAAYANGGSFPANLSATLYRGALSVTLNSTTNIGTTTQPYQLVFTFPGLDFLMMPVSIAGADLVRATLSTQVTLGPSGTDTYSVTLVNGIASY